MSNYEGFLYFDIHYSLFDILHRKLQQWRVMNICRFIKRQYVAIYMEKVVAGFSRYHKYTLGADLRNKSREIVGLIVGLIVKANSAQKKLQLLLDLRCHLEGLMILIRLCKEVKAFKNFKSFQFAVKEAASVSRQNEGWIKCVGERE